MDDLLTVHEVAAYCRVHEVTVRRHIASGKLASVRVGKRIRVRWEDLEPYLDEKPADAVRYPFRQGGRVLAPDDPIFDFIGLFRDEPWVSAEHDRALAEAYSTSES